MPRQNQKTRKHRASKTRTVAHHNPNVLVILTEPGRFAPARLRCKLRYADYDFVERTTTSSGLMNFHYRSSAYDPNPSVLTGSIAGFVELANLYQFYRVHKMVATIEVGNQEVNPITVVAWPSAQLANANSLALSDLLTYSSNPGGRRIMLGRTEGLGIKTFRIVASGNKLVGPTFRTDLSWASSVSSDPIQMYGINIGAFKPSGNFVYPLTCTITILYDVEFFEIRALAS